MLRKIWNRYEFTNWVKLNGGDSDIFQMIGFPARKLETILFQTTAMNEYTYEFKHSFWLAENIASNQDQIEENAIEIN